MKMNRYFMFALAGLTFAACSNDEDSSALTQSKKSVEIAIKNYTNAINRSTGEMTEEQTQCTDISQLTFLFTNGKTALEAKKINDANKIEGSSNKYVFHNIPEGVTAVSIVGNYIEAAVGTNIEDIKKKAVSEQQKTLQDVIVYGECTKLTTEGVQDPDIDNHTPVYSAGEITVAPLLARLEVHSIQCTDLGVKYSAITPQAIGLNNYLDKIDGTATQYMTFTEFTNAIAGWAKDNISDLTLNSLEAKGTDTYVYNIAPGLPEIILQAEVTGNNIQVSNPKYTRATQYKGGSGNIEKFEAGKIYQIAYQFTEDDITTDRGNVICVEATVDIADWEIVNNITPGFN